jgi:hypothetical protein
MKSNKSPIISLQRAMPKETLSKLFRISVWFLPLLALIPGCNGGIPTAPVHGQVKLTAQPVGPGVVILQPIGPQTEPMRGPTTLKFGADGKFEGVAPLGKHEVIIQSDDVADESLEVRGPPKIPIFYGTPEASKLTADIKEGENKLDFDLKAKP